MKLSKKKLRKFLKTNSANSEWDQKPLLFWALDRPTIVNILLNSGADANITIELLKGTYVTPLSMCKIMWRKLKPMEMISKKYALASVYNSACNTIENLKKTMELLHSFGGVEGHYRNYISLDIRD